MEITVAVDDGDGGVGSSNVELAYSGCQGCRHPGCSSRDGNPSQLLLDQASWRTGALFKVDAGTPLLISALGFHHLLATVLILLSTFLAMSAPLYSLNFSLSLSLSLSHTHTHTHTTHTHIVGVRDTQSWMVQGGFVLFN